MLHHPARVLGLGFLFAVISLLFAACGRSNLDGYELVDGGTLADVRPGFDAGDALGDGSDDGRGDTGPDVKACNAATCPTGCCDRAGVCRMGNTPQSCGVKGLQCEDCLAQGFDFCDPMRRACAKNVMTCDATSCPDGCCVTAPRGGLCLGGTSAKACGGQGEACEDCSVRGDSCDVATRTCANAACGPANCPGCCLGAECRVGQDNSVCGENGDRCEDCTAMMGSCVPTPGKMVGGQCGDVMPTCNPTTCPDGCCVGDTCTPGTTDNACGTGASQCVNCGAQNSTCTGQKCVPIPPTCTAANCTGCCDAQQVCHGGFLNTRCGSGASTCADCTASGSTCDLSSTPRVCSNQQTTCPAPYGSCPAAVSTPQLAVQHVCSAADLADARAACAAGAHSASCQAFYAFEQATHPTCALCLKPFDYTFQEAQGIFNCIAPFVSATCDHSTGCAIDCQDSSCAMCMSASTDQCKNGVRTGQCRQFFGQSACIFPGFRGPGAFCSPFGTGGNFGAWLQAVGGHYCQ